MGINFWSGLIKGHNRFKVKIKRALIMKGATKFLFLERRQQINVRVTPVINGVEVLKELIANDVFQRVFVGNTREAHLASVP
jgi:hypothetical protein